MNTTHDGLEGGHVTGEPSAKGGDQWDELDSVNRLDEVVGGVISISELYRYGIYKRGVVLARSITKKPS